MRNPVFLDPEVRLYDDTSRSLSHVWERIRVPIIVPILRLALYVCIGMSVMLFIERVYMAMVIGFVKCFGKKRYTKYNLDAIKEELEKSKNYPKVLVQIPMFNEKEVYKLSIGAVCGLSWPSDRLVVQVLDDSTNEALLIVTFHNLEEPRKCVTIFDSFHQYNDLLTSKFPNPTNSPKQGMQL